MKPARYDTFQVTANQLCKPLEVEKGDCSQLDNSLCSIPQDRCRECLTEWQTEPQVTADQLEDLCIMHMLLLPLTYANPMLLLLPCCCSRPPAIHCTRDGAGLLECLHVFLWQACACDFIAYGHPEVAQVVLARKYF